MKTRSEVQERLRQLQSNQKNVWKDNEPFKNDRIDEIENEIKILMWVLRPTKRDNNQALLAGGFSECLYCGGEDYR